MVYMLLAIALVGLVGSYCEAARTNQEARWWKDLKRGFKP